ncbi:hypothetical protein EJB05_49628 [Eragrostis curvula]|uniref:Uncharacterized protein n=1 Tax=Eragrostis curvula TaxID=38414 RepID=A0A5J9T4X0_9POAL|nr:hypothetical protein EJB05_49628 [Eragrostis curvula]
MRRLAHRQFFLASKGSRSYEAVRSRSHNQFRNNFCVNGIERGAASLCIRRGFIRANLTSSTRKSTSMERKKRGHRKLNLKHLFFSVALLF